MTYNAWQALYVPKEESLRFPSLIQKKIPVKSLVGDVLRVLPPLPESTWYFLRLPIDYRNFQTSLTAGSIGRKGDSH